MSEADGDRDREPYCWACREAGHDFLECSEYRAHRREAAAGLPDAVRELDPVLASARTPEERARRRFG
jgi:hypothetical protein